MKRQYKYAAGAAVVILLALITLVSVHISPKPQNTSSSSRPLYVALGDSVAAGVGLKPDSDSSACNRTDQAYSHVVSGSSYRLISLACSGATITDGISGPQTVNQLELPGQLNQLYKLSQPNMISLTSGANDVGWTEFLSRCYTERCGTATDQAILADRLNILSANFDQVLRDLGDHYSTPPAVYITGYYQVFPTAVPNNCVDLTGIDSDELAFGRSVQDQISTTIRAVASRYSFVHFVPLNFSDHELCTADPWVQGLTASQPYHPTAAGQKSIAEAILSQMKSKKVTT